MKLHLPARLRSALLACMAVLTPMSCTVATGAFVGLGTVAALSASVSQAAEILVDAGSSVDYAPGNSYMLNGGTLNVTGGSVSSAIKVNSAESTVNVAESAKLSPLYVSLGEGVDSFKLSGSGTYDIGTATNMYGANINNTGWTGVTTITSATGVGNFNFNTFGTADSSVKISGVNGWLAFSVAFNPTVWLEDGADGTSALQILDGSTGREYGFNRIKGTGTFERGGTKFSGNVTYTFRGDISEWTGKYVNNYGTTSLSFNGNATTLNMSEIVNNSGYAVNVTLNGSSAAVVNSKIHTTAGGALNLTVGNASGVTLKNETKVTSLVTTGLLTVAKTGSLVVSGASELKSTLRVEGVVSLQGGATVNRTVENSGVLTIAGALNVNSDELRQSVTGDSTFDDGDNGVMTKGQVKYFVIENISGGKFDASGATLSFDGSTDFSLEADGSVLRDKLAGDTSYWVNKGDVSLAATDVASYRMNGGTLVLDKTDAAQQGQALVSVVGDNGTVKIVANTTLTNDMATKSTADLLVTNGATLTVGTGQAQNSFISSFSSVTLDNATLKIEANTVNVTSGYVNNLTVTANGGKLDIRDINTTPPVNAPYVFAGVTRLDGTLSSSLSGWGNAAAFERLAGAGTLAYNNSANEETYVTISSLDGFTGNLSFTQNNNNGSVYEVRISSGKADVTMGALTIGRSNKQTDGDFANMTGSITVEAGKTLALAGALTMQSNLNLSVTDAAGLQLNGGLIVQGLDNNLNILGASAMNLGTLQVQGSASLAVNGLVSSLAMNQSGKLVMDNMVLQDGATLVYNADALVVNVGSELLQGNVKVDLNNLTAAQSSAIAQGTPFDLGISGEVAQNRISAIADNIRDLKMEVIDDTWKVTSGVVSMFWEGGDGSWGNQGWAYQDGTAPSQLFVNGSDAIFSGATATVTVDTAGAQPENVEFYNGSYTLNYNYIGSDVVIGNDLIVGAGATAAFNQQGAFSKNLTVDGHVEVGSGASLSIDMNGVAVGGSLKGEGSVSVSSDLSLGASSDIGQLVVAGSVDMMNTADNNLSVGGTSSAAALQGVGTLTVKDGGSMTVNAASTSLGSLAGDGSLTAGDVTLTSGSSTIGALTATDVTLAGGVTLDVGTLDTRKLTATMTGYISEDTKILAADKTVGDVEVAFRVSSVDSLSKLTNGQVVTIASIGQPGGKVTGDLVAPTAPNPETLVKEWDEGEGFSVTANLRGFGYELKVSDDNKLITMVVGRDNKGWIGESGDTWVAGSQTGWEVGYIPNPTDRAAGFFGYGSSVVQVDEAGVETALVDVDIAKDKLESLPSYTFTGGNVITDNMVIGQGELIVANDTYVRNEAQVYTNGKLSVAETGNLTISGSIALTDAVSLTVAEGGQFSVDGDFTAEEAVVITNAGMFTAEKVDVVGKIDNSGTLQVLDGGSIGSVEGGSVKLFDAKSDCSLEIGSVNVDSLAILGENSEVKLSADSVIGTLSGKEGVEGASLISSAAVVLREAAQNGVNLTAEALTLGAIGNDLGAFDVSLVTLDLENDVLSTDVAALSVKSLVVVEPLQIVLSDSVIESLPLGDDNVIVGGDYKLISGIAGHNLTDFSLADDIMQEIKRRGVTAELKLLGDDDLVLSLGTIEGGMIWDTAKGNVTNNGYVIPTGEGLYKALDYVEQVLVSDSKTIDLTADGVGSAATDATIPSVGLIVRNLDGGGKLTIVGDAADKDGVLPDVVTLLINRDIEKPTTLAADSLLVNIGLPAGESGVLASDSAADTQVLSALEADNGSVISVNSDADVNDRLSLSNGSSLLVQEGAVLTTGKLDGDETAMVGGNVVVDGVGGIYDGSYAPQGALVSFGKGAYQTIKAGDGLALAVTGGEGTLNFGGADATMSRLMLGGSSEQSQLIFNNITQDDKSGTVKQHKLTLTGTDNYINNAEVTFSLGAEATAVTLGSAGVPVIMDGRVSINNSDFVVTMVTAKDSLYALDVAPDAPLKDAVLAQLVNDADISGSNKVTLTGNRAMQALLSKYYTNARLADDGTIRVDRVADYYSSAVPNLSETGQVGLEMMDQVLLNLNPQVNSKEYTDLAEVMNALDDAVQSGKTGEVDRIASAVTGASTATLAMALSGDVERQLRAIRNRTTTMGVDQSSVNHNMPYFNAWINAEVDNRKLDQDGMLPGYDYTSTGGTLGFDVDVTPRFTFGVAFSSLRGDFSSESADQLEADVETFYISGFARATYRRWTHTFVASFGKSDISMDRMVSYSGGSYQTQGDTEAFNFGAMYELGYVMALDADGASCLQPVFNVSLSRSTVDAYTEYGSDAALAVGDVDVTMLTIGVGARMQAVVGENLFNRSSIFEARALIKLNAGDREANVETNMVNVPTAGGCLSSTERDAISLELGAGVTVPVGAISGSIFVEGSAELGSTATDLNATVGYRLNF